MPWSGGGLHVATSPPKSRPAPGSAGFWSERSRHAARRPREPRKPHRPVRRPRRPSSSRTATSGGSDTGGRRCCCAIPAGSHCSRTSCVAPGRDIHVRELDSITPSGGSAVARDAPAPDAGILPLPGDGGEVLDAQARAEYRRRVVELREELDDAEQRHDLGRAETLRAELDLLVDELRAAVGPGWSRAAGLGRRRARARRDHAPHPVGDRADRQAPPVARRAPRVHRDHGLLLRLPSWRRRGSHAGTHATRPGEMADPTTSGSYGAWAPCWSPSTMRGRRRPARRGRMSWPMRCSSFASPAAMPRRSQRTRWWRSSTSRPRR